MSGDGNETNMMVNYLPQGITDEELEAIFSPYGTVTSAKVIRDKMTGYTFGYGFVTMTTHDEALLAIEKVTGLPYKNKKLKAAFSRPRSGNSRRSNVFVTNLGTNDDFRITDEEFTEVFSKYGKVIHLTLLRKDDGSLKGTAFVRYNTDEEADAAIRNLNDTMLPGDTSPIKVKLAEDFTKQKIERAFNKSGDIDVSSSYGGGGPMMGGFRARSGGRYDPMARGGGGGGGYGGRGGGRGGYAGAPSANNYYAGYGTVNHGSGGMGGGWATGNGYGQNTTHTPSGNQYGQGGPFTPATPYGATATGGGGGYQDYDGGHTWINSTTYPFMSGGGVAGRGGGGGGYYPPTPDASSNGNGGGMGRGWYAGSGGGGGWS